MPRYEPDAEASLFKEEAPSVLYGYRSARCPAERETSAAASAAARAGAPGRGGVATRPTLLPAHAYEEDRELRNFDVEETDDEKTRP